MAAVDTATAVAPRSRPVCAQDEALRRLAFWLSRSLAAEGIADDLYDALEEVLGEQAPPALDAALRILDRFRRAATQLLYVVPHRVTAYPTEELGRLIVLREAQPTPDQVVAHLRRFALAILNVLDLIGDDE